MLVWSPIEFCENIGGLQHYRCHAVQRVECMVVGSIVYVIRCGIMLTVLMTI